MECVLFPKVVDEKVVDDEGEGDWAPCVGPEARSVRRLKVSFFCEELGELLVGHDACLGQTVHASANSNVDVAVVCQLQKVVLFDYFVGNEMYRDLHVLSFRWAVHQSTEVEVIYIHAGGFGIVG